MKTMLKQNGEVESTRFVYINSPSGPCLHFPFSQKCRSWGTPQLNCSLVLQRYDGPRGNDVGYASKQALVALVERSRFQRIVQVVTRLGADDPAIRFAYSLDARGSLRLLESKELELKLGEAPRERCSED